MHTFTRRSLLVGAAVATSGCGVQWSKLRLGGPMTPPAPGPVEVVRQAQIHLTTQLVHRVDNSPLAPATQEIIRGHLTSHLSVLGPLPDWPEGLAPQQPELPSDLAECYVTVLAKPLEALSDVDGQWAQLFTQVRAARYAHVFAIADPTNYQRIVTPLTAHLESLPWDNTDWAEDGALPTEAIASYVKGTTELGQRLETLLPNMRMKSQENPDQDVEPQITGESAGFTSPTAVAQTARRYLRSDVVALSSWAATQGVSLGPTPYAATTAPKNAEQAVTDLGAVLNDWAHTLAALTHSTNASHRSLREFTAARLCSVIRCSAGLQHDLGAFPGSDL